MFSARRFPSIIGPLAVISASVLRVGNFTPNRHAEFAALWAETPKLRDNFLLLTVEEASNERLFGPDPPVPKVRPRLGDFTS